MTDTELQTAVEPVETSESAPGTKIQEGVKPTETVEGQTEVKPDDPKGFIKRINKKTYEAEEAKRQAEDLRLENERLKAQLPQEQRPVVPEPPDPYDADYAEQLKAYTQAVSDAAAYDAGQQVRTEAETQKALEAQQKLQDEWTNRALSYTENAKTLGIDAKELQLAGQTVAAFGVSDDLTQHILEDEQGPLITRFLAHNPGELEKIVGMTTAQAAVYVETTVKPKASASSGISGAPKPVESLGGGGAPPTQRGPAGATFE